MNKIPSYGKVLTLGSAYTENALVGEVIVQEKIDGSQFKWHIDDSGELIISSRNRLIHAEAPEMFKAGVETLTSRSSLLKTQIKPNSYFYGEYLSKPKHNTLKYSKIPKNHIVLFDALIQCKWATRKELQELADLWEIDLIPEFFVGEITVDDLKKFHEKESYLGGETVEGIVIKNYNQTILQGGNLYPLFTKYVSEKFKERHQDNPDHKTPRQTIDEWCKSFCNENRWLKAMQYCRDDGTLVQEPKDIGTVIKRIMVDIDEEDTEDIKKFLYDRYIRTIKSWATRGFPEWYKEQLLKNIK